MSVDPDGDDGMGMEELDHDEDKTMIRQLQKRRPLLRSTSIHKLATQGADQLDVEGLSSVDAKDETGLTLLHHAVMAEQKDMVKRLLEEGATLDMQNRLGRNALHLAVWTGNLAITTMLCDVMHQRQRAKRVLKSSSIKVIDGGRFANNPLNAQDLFGATPLHWAVQRNRADIVNLLLEHNVNLSLPDQHGLLPLHVAADEGSTAALIELLSLFTDHDNNKNSTRRHKNRNAVQDVNAKDNSGSTPLHHASLKGHGDCVTKLLQAGADINAKNACDDTPIHLAAARLDTKTLELLLKAGADLRVWNQLGKTPLHSMTAWGHHSVIEAVPKDKDLLDAQDVNGKTALMMAVSWGHAKVLQVLLAGGGDINQVDNAGNTALHHAAQWSKHQCLQLLLDAGINVLIADKRGRTALHDSVQEEGWMCADLLLQNMAEGIDHQDNDGLTALHLAALVGNEQLLERILAKGANVNISDSKGRNVFHCLAIKGVGLEVIRPYNVPINARDNEGRTALHHAVWNGNTEFARELLQDDFGGDVNTENNRGVTPLQYAVYRGMSDCAELLLYHQADPNAKDKDRRAVLHYAVIGNKEKCIRLLVKNNVMMSRTDLLGQTALHYAAKLGHVSAVNCLLEDSGLRLNLMDKHNDTPLHLAVQNSHNAVVYALVNSGRADLGLKNNQGKLAIDIAFSYYNKEIFQFLLEKITSRYDSAWMDVYLTNTNTEEDGGQSNKMRELIRSQPESAKVVFDGCIKRTPDHQGYVAVDFQYIDDLEKNPGMSKTNHPMYILAAYGNKNLLSHALPLLCLKHKWRIAFLFYVMFLFFYMSFVFLFIAHMLAATSYLTVGLNVQNNQSALPSQSSPFYDISPYLICVLAAVGIGIELVQLFLTRKKYLEWHNVLDWMSYVGAIVVVIDTTGDSSSKPDWQWELGCFVVLLQCMNLLFFLRVFPRFGIYVVMVSLILKTFIESFIVLFLFIVAFAMTFYLLLFNQFAFSTPGYSIMKSLVMMLGEIDFGSIFHAYRESPSPDALLHFEAMTYAVMCGFLLISIIIVNLLTGLAVSDVQMLRENSESQMISMQINLALDLEFALLKWKTVHDKFYNQTVITLSTALIDMKQLSMLERWRHSIFNFFQGPLYRQDILRKIIHIIDEREYNKASTNQQQQGRQVSQDAKDLAKTVLDKLNAKESAVSKSSPSASSSPTHSAKTQLPSSKQATIQVKPVVTKQVAWEESSPNASAQQAARQKQLEQKVDQLSRDVKECMEMLRSIMQQQSQ